METGEAPKEVLDTQKPVEGTDTAAKPQESQHHGGIGGFFRNLFGAHETTPAPAVKIDLPPTQQPAQEDTASPHTTTTSESIPNLDSSEKDAPGITPEAHEEPVLQPTVSVETSNTADEFHPALNPLRTVDASPVASEPAENIIQASEESSSEPEQETQEVEHVSRSRTWTEVGE